MKTKICLALLMIISLSACQDEVPPVSTDKKLTFQPVQQSTVAVTKPDQQNHIQELQNKKDEAVVITETTTPDEAPELAKATETIKTTESAMALKPLKKL